MPESDKFLQAAIIFNAFHTLFSKKRKIPHLEFFAHEEKEDQREKRLRIDGYLIVVDNYLGDDFKSHFRMKRETMEFLISTIGHHVCRDGLQRRLQESLKLQCLVTVWVLANQESYRSIADRFNISKSTVYHFLCRICNALNSAASAFIKWPVGLHAIQVMEGFKAKKGFPNVIGAIDGAHIDIKPPTHNSTSYINRKGRPSMILQAVCTHNCMFTDCFAGFPDSVHDARVFLKSGLKQKCLEDHYFPQNSHLLGDSAYPLGEHILVPFKDNGHLSRNQIKYNIAHAATRVAIERAFGLLKGRWRRLKYLELHTTNNLATTIVAACVLHNICLQNKDNFEGDLVNSDVNNQEIQNNTGLDYARGAAKRNMIMLQL